MIAVTRLSTTPVKGTALHHHDAVELGSNGLSQNRMFFLIDSAGKMVNGKRFGSLVQVRADYDPVERRLALRTPHGFGVHDVVELTDERTITDFYGRPVKGTVVSGPFSRFLGDHLGTDVRLVHAEEPGGGVDVHPVTLISTATSDLIRDAAGGPAKDWLDRFRILVEVEGAEPFEEETWEGRNIAVGGVVLTVIGPIPRCVVTTQNPLSGEADFETLAAIHKVRGEFRRALSTPTEHLPDGGRLVLGVYATVARPGVIRRGDSVK
jgi:uncharacterized protein YcbX